MANNTYPSIPGIQFNADSLNFGPTPGTHIPPSFNINSELLNGLQGPGGYSSNLGLGQNMSPQALLGGIGSIDDAKQGYFSRLLSGDPNTLKGTGSVLGGLGAIGQTFLGIQNYGLAKDQLDLTERVLNRNLANNTAAANAEYAQRQGARRSFGGAGAGGPDLKLDGRPV